MTENKKNPQGLDGSSKDSTDQSKNSIKWEEIPWLKMEKSVAKIQRQIYRAESKGDRHKVRRLQRTLIRSKANILLSIRKITQVNKGKKTPGNDNAVYLDNHAREELYEMIIQENLNKYNPPPAKRVYIEKKNGKLRPLGLPTIKDRVIQNMIKNALEPEWEVKFEPTMYGFRPKRNTHDALERIHTSLSPKKKKYIFEGDFAGCFDHLSHGFILDQISDFPAKKLVEKWLKAGYMDNNVFVRGDEGTPQGAVISPLLANIALNGMEDCLGITYKKRIQRYKNRQPRVVYTNQSKYSLSRFADDFVIMCETYEDAENIFDLLQPYLKDRNLKLQTEKTKITEVTQGFDFLGFTIRKFDSKKNKKRPGKIIIKPSKESVVNAKGKIKEIFKKNKGGNVGHLIEQLNPVIRGIANYWSPEASSETYKKLDHFIFNNVRRYIKRLHPKKSWKWIRNRYFKPDKTGQSKDRWILTDPETKTQLVKMSWTPIVRHNLIQYKNSPYNGELTEYFQKRDQKEFDRNNVLYRRKLAIKQKYICPICDQPINDPNGEYETHHWTPKCCGGTGEYKNLALVHKNCHRNYHKVFKPKYGRPTDNNIKAFKLVFKKKLLG